MMCRYTPLPSYSGYKDSILPASCPRCPPPQIQTPVLKVPGLFVISIMCYRCEGGLKYINCGVVSNFEKNNQQSSLIRYQVITIKSPIRSHCTPQIALQVYWYYQIWPLTCFDQLIIYGIQISGQWHTWLNPGAEPTLQQLCTAVFQSLQRLTGSQVCVKVISISFIMYH